MACIVISGVSMTPETTDDDLTGAPGVLGSEFRTGELAYLAATSKVEGRSETASHSGCIRL